MMKKILYFSYGSNMNLTQMKNRCPDSEKISIAHMKDAVICFPSFYESWQGGVAGFENAPGKILWGVLFHISESDLKNLRKFEEYDPNRPSDENSYNEVEIEIIADAEVVKCMTYEARVTGNFKPSQRYLQTILNGAIENELPVDYIESLSKIL